MSMASWTKLLASIALASAAGDSSRHPTDDARAAVIVREAQARSQWGTDPVWIGFAGEEALVRQIRDRAYAYCLYDGIIDAACAVEEDEATHSVVLTMLLLGAQRRMADKSHLSFKERWVADHPEIVVHARTRCWALYEAHGGKDARLLDHCLSNLIDSSQLVGLPVFD